MILFENIRIKLSIILKMSLSSKITNVLIIRHKEDITELIASLNKENLSTFVVQSSYNNEQEKYSQSFKCLLTHKKAWEKCTNEPGVYLIVESDFIPVKGIGNLPTPCHDSSLCNSITHIYSSAQRPARIDERGYIYGHSSTALAYIVDSKSAKKLLQLSTLIFKHDPNIYLPWDIVLPRLAASINMRIYFPLKSYGEHGGAGNPEHKKAGINGIHRADSLIGELYFLPEYAKGQKSIYYLTRIIHKARAFARIFLGKYIEPRVVLNPEIGKSEKMQMIKMGFVRLLN